MMDTQYYTDSLSTSFLGGMANLLSPETRQLMSLGRDQGWGFAVLGQAPLPEEPVRLGDWLIVPAHQDSSLVPARTLERIQSIFTAGLRPKGFVVVHEAPLLLTAPELEDTDTLQLSAITPQLKSALKLACVALGIVAATLVVVSGLAILAVAALLLAATLAIPAFLVVGAVLLDPILVAVTEDGYWVEIDRWLGE